MADLTTSLTLGDFEFAGLEIPASISFGGTQALAVQRLVGGVKVVDAMGVEDRPPTWSGMFLGKSAEQRARYLDTLRKAGRPLTLTWGGFSYLVVIREFNADYRRPFEIGYSITCEVVQDNTAPVSSPGTAPVDQAVTQDANAASTLSDAIGDSTLSGLMASVQGATAAVSSFATAARSTLNSVLQPIAAAQKQVGVLIASAANVATEVTTFGGLLPGNPVAAAAARMSSQVAAVAQLGQLYQLQGLLGRMSNNLGAVAASSAQVATAGGNLFRIAEQQYGDAGAWTTIAAANGLTDPFIQGAQVLEVPALPGDKTGVLNA